MKSENKNEKTARRHNVVKVLSQGRGWRGAAAWQREHAGRGGAAAVGHDRDRLQAEASPGPGLLCVNSSHRVFRVFPYTSDPTAENVCIRVEFKGCKYKGIEEN